MAKRNKNKKERIKESIIFDSLRKYRGGKMRDRRLRRNKEKICIEEGW